MAETTEQERRFWEYKLAPSQPRLSLEDNLGKRRAKEIRGLLHRSVEVTAAHDRSAENRDDPGYVKGVKVTAHDQRVGEVAYEIACYMGLSDGQRVIVLLAGKLHDVGKKDQDIHLLRELSDEQRMHIHDHAMRSAEYIDQEVRRLKDPRNIEMMQVVSGVVKRHHKPEVVEDFVVHFADKFSAMTEPRDRPPMHPRHVLKSVIRDLRKDRYSHFRRWVAPLAWALHSMLPPVAGGSEA